MTNTNAIVIIPARYASTRFPGKPLALLAGRTIIEHVYRRAAQAVASVCVATDDERIKQCVEAFGGNAVMTSADCHSGTDRVAEAYGKLGKEYSVVVNVQGDEPFISPNQILSLIDCFSIPSTDIATIVKPYRESDGTAALLNPNTPKVVVGRDMRALYFSRSVVPYLRGVEQNDWLARHKYYKHIGIYAFRPHVLQEVAQLPQGELERAESLEQLRWIENGYRIKVGVSDIETIGIDTPQDLARAEEHLRKACKQK